jgi:hypothetical protein
MKARWNRKEHGFGLTYNKVYDVKTICNCIFHDNVSTKNPNTYLFCINDLGNDVGHFARIL